MSKNYDWTDLERLIGDEASSHIRKFGPELEQNLSKSLEQDLFGDTPSGPIRSKHSKDQLHFSKVFRDYQEVDSCVQRLKDIPVYIGTFPYRSALLDKNRYLRYHIENYFHEIYMLRERLITYLKRLGRSFKEDRRHDQILAATKPLFASVKASLLPVTNTRSAHVHRARYDSSELARLDTIQLISRIDEFSEGMKEAYDLAFRETRGEWKTRLESNNREIGKLLDQIANRLVPVLFDTRRKRLKYPRRKAS